MLEALRAFVDFYLSSNICLVSQACSEEDVL